MHKPIDNIFIIPVLRDYIIYSPLNGISAFVNGSGVVELKKQIEQINKRDKVQASGFNELAHDILNSPTQQPRRKTGSLKPEFLGIITTRECNGACNYCDFGADKASRMKMSYKLAAEIVDWYVAICEKQKKNTIEIHFFGGEPMVAADVIEVIVHRTRMLAARKTMMPYFEISTNGQYGEKRARWLGNYFNKVVLSFDGFKDVHNKHRPLPGNKSSFENALATAQIISESQADLCIRCCISKLNVSHMEEITRWCCDNLRLSAINFEILCATDTTRAKGLFPPDPVEFAVNFQRSREYALQYGVEIVYASDISENPQVSSCPVGKDTAIISPEGRIDNCYLLPERWQKIGLDLNLGYLKTHQNFTIDKTKVKAIREMVENKPRCRNCFCKWSCAGGCHVGNTFPDCTLEYDDFCRQTRLISTFSLLADMNMKEKSDALLNSPEAIKNIINRKSDKFDSLTS